jgi:hypothetical protein
MGFQGEKIAGKYISHSVNLARLIFLRGIRYFLEIRRLKNNISKLNSTKIIAEMGKRVNV